MGLGSLNVVGLAEARERAMEARKLRAQGADPIEARMQERAKARLGAATSITFKEAAAAYIKAHQASWRNKKHAAQWAATLETYAYPILGTQPVQLIDAKLIIDVLEPIWSAKPETASRVRGRVEAILDREIALGRRLGPNPARWRGNLDHTLPKRTKVRKIRHHPALPYSETGEFMTLLRQRDSVSAAALEFVILTAARTGEVIGALWGEIDEMAKVWTVPAERMKGDIEHRVPLSAPALAVIARMRDVRNSEYVFPGATKEKPLSNMALLSVLRHLKRNDITVHGFRSTFRDWAAERSQFPREVIEMALAHAISDQTEAAYRRGDLFDKRCRLMDAWAKACSTVQTSGEIIPIGRMSALASLKHPK